MHTADERHVVVGVSGSLGSLAALHRAADEVRRGGGRLWAVHAWEPPVGEAGHRGALSAAALAEDCRRGAVHILLGALEAAFTGAGPDVATDCFIARGAPGRALVAVAGGERDLLVVGAGHRGLLRRALFPSVARYCVAHAVCPVLTVPPSPLQSELESATRLGGKGLPFDIRELDSPGVTGA